MMATGWETYLLLIDAAGLACGMIGLLRLFTRALSKNSPKPDPAPSTETPNSKSDRFNVRFTHASSLLVSMIGLTLLLIPIAATRAEGIGAKALILSTVLLLLVMLFYSVRKGDLSWLRSYRKERP